MLTSLLNFTRKTLATIGNFIAPTPAAQKAALKALSVNFDTTTLIPNEIKPESYAKWVEAYLKEMPPLSVVLWLKNNHLQLSYNRQDQITHHALPAFHLDQQTKLIQREHKNVSLNDVLSTLAEPVDALSLVDAQRLPEVKFKVQLALKFISPELISHVKTDTQRSLHNLESSTNCSICMDEYNNDNPPFLVERTASVYHAPCLEEYRSNQRHGALRDPKTNTLIAHHADETRLDSIGITDLAYLCAVEDSKALQKNYKALTKMFDALLEENRSLQTQIEAHRQVAQDPPAAPIAHAGQREESKVSRKRTRKR